MTHRIRKINANPYQLFEFQQEMVEETILAWDHGHSSVLTQSPTGSGKSICQAELIRRALDRGEQVLVATHRKEILSQLQHTFQNHTGIIPELIVANSKPDWDYPLLLAMNQTLSRRVDKIPKSLGLYIQDECHHSAASTYRKILESLPHTCRVSGWTATPLRTNGEGFKDIYSHLVLGPQTGWLIHNKYLSQYTYLADPKPMSTHGVEIQKGDYIAAQIARANDAVYLSADIVESYQKYCNEHQAVVFCVTTEHSRTIEKTFRSKNISAAHLDANTPQEDRHQIINQFRKGEIKVIVNVEILGEGFDVPALEAVIMARPTCSLVLFLQMVGRALRFSEGKTARIIDLAGNWERHGMPCFERSWTLDATAQDYSNFADHGTSHEDRNRQKIISTGQAELVPINPSRVRYWQFRLQDYLYTQKKQGHPKMWIWHQLRQSTDVPITAWQDLGKILNKEKTWGLQQWHCWTQKKDTPEYIAERKEWEGKDIPLVEPEKAPSNQSKRARGATRTPRERWEKARQYIKTWDDRDIGEYSPTKLADLRKHEVFATLHPKDVNAALYKLNTQSPQWPKEKALEAYKKLRNGEDLSEYKPVRRKVQTQYLPGLSSKRHNRKKQRKNKSTAS